MPLVLQKNLIFCWKMQTSHELTISILTSREVFKQNFLVISVLSNMSNHPFFFFSSESWRGFSWDHQQTWIFLLLPPKLSGRDDVETIALLGFRDSVEKAWEMVSETAWIPWNWTEILQIKDSCCRKVVFNVGGSQFQLKPWSHGVLASRQVYDLKETRQCYKCQVFPENTTKS